jgi:uncharacterized protein (DUF2236 family)
MPDAFPHDSVIRRVSAEPALLFGAGRALLLQLAHPAVAAGVDEHSDFRRNPFKRLEGTLEAVYTMVYGPDDLADGVGRRIRWIHEFVVGPSYRANDPENLLWVHATLLDTALHWYERFVRPLSVEELDRYYDEMATVAGRFGCPRDAQPADIGAFRRYFDAQVASLTVTDTGRSLARDIVAPKLPANLHVPLAPALGLQRLITIGTLPAPLRTQFGFEWDDARERRLRRTLRVLRASYRAAPRPLRTAPTQMQSVLLLRRARRHVAEFDARAARAGGRAAAREGA